MERTVKKKKTWRERARERKTEERTEVKCLNAKITICNRKMKFQIPSRVEYSAPHSNFRNFAMLHRMYVDCRCRCLLCSKPNPMTDSIFQTITTTPQSHSALQSLCHITHLRTFV